MRMLLAGEGAIARRHVAALRRIEGVEIAGVVGGQAEDTAAFAEEFAIERQTLSLAEALRWPDVDAVVLTTPTPLHAEQAIEVMEAGRHVLIEIPMADSLADSEAVVAAQERTGVTAMVCHTRRFNPSHIWVHDRLQRGDLALQHLVVETFFFRRTNTNALGRPRTWTDHLLWHHACHTVDLFQYQTGTVPSKLTALAGPHHADLGIAMDMSIGMQAPSGALCTLALSFNNDGPFGTFFRYICDNGTYVARYDDLVTGNDEPIDLSGVAVSSDGFEVQDREFVDAIANGREPNASVARCLPTMRTLAQLEDLL